MHLFAVPLSCFIRLIVFLCLLGPGVALGQEASRTFTALDHGFRQLKRMLADVPDMATDPKTGRRLLDAEMEQTIAKLFAGERAGLPIFWSPEIPVPPFAACHSVPRKYGNAAIQIRRIDLKTGKPFDFDALWSHALFEMFNAESWRDFNRLSKAAAEGFLAQTDFVKLCMHTEFLAFDSLETFYAEVWRPWEEANEIPTDPRNWEAFQDVDFHRWFAEYDREAPYWVCLAEAYDHYQKFGAYFANAEAPNHDLDDYFTPRPTDEILREEFREVRTEEIKIMLERVIGD